MRTGGEHGKGGDLRSMPGKHRGEPESENVEMPTRALTPSLYVVYGA